MPINYKLYPPDWKTRIVPAVLKRANNCCEVCGLQNGQTIFSYKEDGKTVWSKVGWINTKPVRIVLTVAHLDHDEGNHDVSLDRLKAMCQMCHLRYDAAEKKRRRLKAKQNG